MKELLEDTRIRFVVGLAMLIAGLWMFVQRVYVASNFFNMGIMIGGLRVRSGILVIPLLAGLVWMFFKPKSKLAKILSIIGLAIIVVYAITSVNIRVAHTPILTWIFILLLIVIGGILVWTAIIKRRQRSKD